MFTVLPFSDLTRLGPSFTFLDVFPIKTIRVPFLLLFCCIQTADLSHNTMIVTVVHVNESEVRRRHKGVLSPLRKVCPLSPVTKSLHSRFYSMVLTVSRTGEIYSDSEDRDYLISGPMSTVLQTSSVL